jgi:rare lipoprotein A
MPHGSRPSHPLRLASLAALAALAGCASSPSVTPPATSSAPPPTPAEIEQIPDPVPQLEPRSARGNPPFYEVFGKRYFVMKDAAGYVERGIASWYGPGFHAASTSNGERYDMYAMTAAHKTLPLPTYVQVTNLRNGRSVVVRVNDRGPFKEGRIIDLSYTAAAKLDMLRDGTAFVEVRALTPQQPAAPAQAVPIYIQAGAFGSEANALSLVERLRTNGVDNGFVRRDEVNGRTLYRVRVGPLPDVGEFDRLVARLKSLGIADAQLAAD